VTNARNAGDVIHAVNIFTRERNLTLERKPSRGRTITGLRSSVSISNGELTHKFIVS
jgi:hypothetical protein